MKIAFWLVDVFTEVPFAGNQLCVVPDPPDDLDAETMATLAREIGFSETTFVTGIRENGYDVRIFTPDAELPFAGHPARHGLHARLRGARRPQRRADVGGG